MDVRAQTHFSVTGEENIFFVVGQVWPTARDLPRLRPLAGWATGAAACVCSVFLVPTADVLFNCYGPFVSDVNLVEPGYRIHMCKNKICICVMAVDPRKNSYVFLC